MIVDSNTPGFIKEVTSDNGFSQPQSVLNGESIVSNAANPVIEITFTDIVELDTFGFSVKSNLLMTGTVSFVNEGESSVTSKVLYTGLFSLQCYFRYFRVS